MLIFGYFVPLPALIALVVAIVAAYVFWPSLRARPAQPATNGPAVPPAGASPTRLGKDSAQQHIFGPITPSIWGGLALCAVLALLLYNLFGEIVPADDDFSEVRAVVAVVIAGYYFYVSLVTVETGSRGATLFFGKGRYPFLCSRMGLPEGLNFAPYGIVTVKEVDVREMQIKFMDNVEAYTSDQVLATVSGFLQRTFTDVFAYLGVVEADKSLAGLALQATRTVIKQYSAKELVQKSKDELSLEIEEELDRLITEDGTNPEAFNWGLEVRHVVVEEIRVPEGIEKAWAEKTRQQALGEAENLEAERRKEQTKTLVESGVKPDTAIAASLINAGKPGASVTSFSIHGIESFGAGLHDIGEGIAKFAERNVKPGGKPPSTPKSDKGGHK